MTESSDETQDSIDYLDPTGDLYCQHTNVYYRVMIAADFNQGKQIDNEMQESTGFAGKNTTEIGATGEVGQSGPMPKASGKVSGKKQWSTEYTNAESDIHRETVSVSGGVTVEYVQVNPNNVDLTNPNIVSGCRPALDEENESNYCENDIQDVMAEYAIHAIDDAENVRKEINNSINEVGIKGLDDPKAERKGVVGRYVDKAKNGVGTAVSRARSSVSSAVNKAQQRFEQDETMLHVSPSDDASVTFSEGNNEVAVRLADRETETPGTTVHVAANDEMVNTSYDEDRTVTVGIADEADATIAVSPGADENEPPTVGGDDIQFSFDDGDIRVSPHDDDGIPMATDENGIIQMTVGDGHTTSEPSNEKTAEQDTTPETAKDIDPTTSRTRDPDRDEPSKPVDSAASANGAATNDAEPSNESNTKWIGSDPPENLPSWIETDSQRTDDEEGINPNAAIDPDRENTDDDTPGSIG